MSLLRSRREATRPQVGSVLTRVAVASVVGSLLLVVTSGQEPDEGPGEGAASALAPAAASSCTDVLVVGIDGNGQGRGASYGPVVKRVTDGVARQAARANRTVTFARVRVGTPASTTLVAGSRAGAKATTAVSARKVRRWAKPVKPALRKTRALLADRMADCPDRQVLLVGYAQGAAVAHRALQDLEKKGALTDVAGAVLVSDPYRVSRSSAGKPLGTPAAGRRSVGVVTRYAKSPGDVPAPTGTYGVVSVCTRSDLVCDPRGTTVRSALGAAGSYQRGAARPVLRKAAQAAWARLSLWPDPVEQQVMVAAGEPLSVQLQVTGGSPTVPPARWTPVSVPDGLRLSADGVLTGVLKTFGVYEVSFTVAGTSPVTSSRSGSVLLNVRAASGALSAGGSSACEVRADGTAWCWGRNDFGQLGDGTTTLRPSPTQVLGTDWARIATGGSSTCGVKRDGTLWCWGLNNFGQLGGADKAGSATPRQVGTAATWKEVTASWTHACATQTDGSLWCWGQNLRGQLGNGKTSGRSSAPERVVGGQQWATVTAGGWHTCGTTTDGSGWCWGENTFGQVGDGTTTLRVKPQRVAGSGWTQLSAAWGRTCGVRVDGGLQCWGDNAEGGLGDGTRQDRTTPVPVAGGTDSWAQVSAGTLSTCASERNGTVWCWGDNRYGQLGPAAGGSSDVPVHAGVTSAGGAVTAGWLHACGIGPSGPQCWGANDSAQLGTGAPAAPAMPPRAAPSWPRTTPLTHQQVKQWGPKRIARAGVSGRPEVTSQQAARRAGGFNVMQFNVLGSQHTAPSGGRPAFAPGRVRAEWSKQLIAARNASLVGTQELQPDQVVSLDVATQGAFSIFPGNTMGYAAATQSLMWRNSDWELVWGSTVSMPFMRTSRPQPVVRLRHRSTGNEVYMINVHLSPGKMEADRDKALDIIVSTIRELNPDGLPILLTGDFNEHREAFCTITGKTNLVAAQGGRNGTTCEPPKHMRVDWVFGSRGKFSGTSIVQDARVRRTTDHAVISSHFAVQ